MAINYALHYFLVLLILLVFAQLITFNAVPTSGIRHNLLHETQDIPTSVNTHDQRMAMENGEEEVIIDNVNGRMDLELENKQYNIDYSGPGANDHHTPKPPSLKG